MKRHIIATILFITALVPAIRPILTSGYFPMHDDTQVGRVVVMGRALRNGQLPVRWVSDLGYGLGYPIFNFYGPLPYYVGGFSYALGVSGLTATKIMFVTGILLSGLTMYAFASSVFGRMGGLLAGLLYLYAPYHAVQIYVRGAVGEFWALSFFPLVAWGFWQMLYPKRRKLGVLLGGIGMAGVILSHTILGFTTTIFITLALSGYWLMRYVRRTLDSSLLTSHLLLLLVGLGLSAFFWLPAIFEIHYTSVALQVGSSANFRDHFVCFGQLWNSSWGFGGSAPGCIDGMSFKLGKLHVILSAASLLYVLTRGKKLRSLVVAVTLASLVSIFLMLEISRPIWELIPGFPYVQYPWRFLSYAIFGLSFVGAGALSWFPNKFIRWTSVTLVIIFILSMNDKLFIPQYIYEKPAKDFESETELTWRVSKTSDEYLPPEIIKPQGSNDIVRETITHAQDVAVDREIDTETYVKSSLSTTRETEIVVNRAYFPGWQYMINGKEVEPRIENGLPYVKVFKGNSTLEVRFTNTPIRLVGNTISLLCLTVLIIHYGKKTIA